MAIDLKVAADFGLGKNGGQEVARIEGDNVRITSANGRDTLKDLTIPKSLIPFWRDFREPVPNVDLMNTFGLANFKLTGDSRMLYVIGGYADCADRHSCSATLEGTRVISIDPRTGATSSFNIPGRGVTAVAFSVVNGERTLALGFSHGGVSLYRPEGDGRLTKTRDLYQDWNRGRSVTYPRDAVSALKFGDIGKGHTGLAVGRLGFNNGDRDGNMVYLLDATAGYAPRWDSRPQKSFGTANVMPTSFAFGHLADSGDPQLAVGYFQEGTKAPEGGDPRVEVLYAEDGRSAASRTSQGITQPVGLDALQFVSQPGTNAQNLVVGAWGGQQDQVLRGTGTQGLDPLTLPNGEQAADEQTLRDWFPGYRGGLFTVRNDTGAPVYFSLKSAADKTRGCWTAEGTAANRAVPDTPTMVGQGAKSPEYYSGSMLDADVSGGSLLKCTDAGRRFAYLTVEPEGKPGEGEQALRTIVKLEVSDDKVAVV
ncbi:hypothetical protein, partial [Streptomyces sp. NPDC001774]